MGASSAPFQNGEVVCGLGFKILFRMPSKPHGAVIFDAFTQVEEAALVSDE